MGKGRHESVKNDKKSQQYETCALFVGFTVLGSDTMIVKSRTAKDNLGQITLLGCSKVTLI